MAKRKDASNQIALFSNAVPNGSSTSRLRRSLFIPAFLRDEARKRAHLYGDDLDRAHAILKKWAELAARGALARKETSLDAEFLRAVFTDGLGYSPFTEGTAQYHLERQFSVPGAGTADGALGIFTAGQPVLPVALIELKSADVNLDTDRFNGRTPVQQLWDYLNAVPECPWGVLSNFISFRLYHRDHGSRAFELFTLVELTRPERFWEFYHLFGPGGLLPTRSDPTPRALALLARTGERQREVGDELYTAYSTN
ncbi:MAG: type I restriction enzyme HsdR N-terminal domain-containing protein, partial [Planctomycetota bacterium]